MIFSGSNRNGFTLFEVTVVMSVVIVVTSIGVVGLSRLQNLFRLRSSADEIKAQIQYARELAIANKDRAIYNVNLSGNIFKLQADGMEVFRFQVPEKVVLNPASFNWVFAPITGEIENCSSCQIILSTGDQSEIINILKNGIVD